MATETTKIPFVEGSAASTPAAGRVVVYAKSDGLMYSKDDAGAETLMSAGGVPVGTELDYAEFTSPVSITATTDATQQTVISGNAVAYDGTPIWVEFGCSDIATQATTGAYLVFGLWDGATQLGDWLTQDNAAAAMVLPLTLRRKLTPTAATHTYIIKSHTSAGTGTVQAGAGGVATRFPGYIRITKA